MKVVLFCGGLGLRIRGYADDIPKPMVQIGNHPILWHLMKYYAHYGHKDFILCLGYKGATVKEYFLNYNAATANDFVWSCGGKEIRSLNSDIDDWTITFVETGLHSTIGQRLKAVEPHLQGAEVFLANYADALSDVPLPTLIEEAKDSGSIASMLLIRPPVTFDMVRTDDEGLVTDVRGLSNSETWINGGFFVLRQEIFNYIQPGDELVRQPFQRLIARKRLYAHRYQGFWQCMDTFKEKQQLEELNSQPAAPWKVWEEDAPVGSALGALKMGA